MNKRQTEPGESERDSMSESCFYVCLRGKHGIFHLHNIRERIGSCRLSCCIYCTIRQYLNANCGWIIIREKNRTNKIIYSRYDQPHKIKNCLKIDTAMIHFELLFEMPLYAFFFVESDTKKHCSYRRRICRYGSINAEIS